MLPAEATRHRFTVQEYRKMAEVGILHDNDRVELVGGEIVEINPIGTRHLACVVSLTHLLVASSRGRYFVSAQNPISLSDDDEPRPDLSLLKERPRPNAEAPPGPADVLLVVEVSDTTLAYDRNVKLSLYAGAGILEAWIVDPNGAKVEVYYDPEGGRYKTVREHRRGSEVRSENVSGLALPVEGILG